MIWSCCESTAASKQSCVEQVGPMSYRNSFRSILKRVARDSGYFGSELTHISSGYLFNIP